jgi:Endonuclease/Exonuclease/phosphatase family
MSRREILGQEQYMNLFCPAPPYKKVTADPQPAEPEPIGWERPILHVRIGLEGGKTLHILNVHLKSKAPTDIVGQNKDVPDPKPPPFAWRTAFGWAEGFFVSSMKRVGQALEARIIVDDLFNQDASALIVVCGDFNADSDDVPVQAIRGDVENTGNPALSRRVLVPCEQSIPESARYSYLYHGKGEMIDNLLVSRILLEFYGVRRSTTSCCTMSRLPSPSTRSTLRAITPRWWPTSTCHSRDLGTPPTDRAREGGAHGGHCRDRAARHGVGRDHDTKTPHIPLFSDTPTAGWSNLVARRPHYPKVADRNRTSANVFRVPALGALV